MEQAQRLFKNVCAKNTDSQLGIEQSGICSEAGVGKILNDPRRFVAGRHVCVVFVEDKKVAHDANETVTEIERSMESSAQNGFRHANELRARQGGDHFIAMRRRIAERARFQQRSDQRDVFLFADLSEITADHQNFFGMPAAQIDAGRGADAPGPRTT